MQTCSFIRILFSLIVSLAVFLGVSACSSLSKQDTRLETEVTFRTKITTENLKHFEIQIKNGTRTAFKIIDPTTYRNAKKQRKYSAKKLEKIAREKIQVVNFCKDGYWLMEVQTLTENLKVRGECNEIASIEDRQSFPNTLSEW